MKIIAIDVSPFEDDERCVAENIRNEIEGGIMVVALNRAVNVRCSKNFDPFTEYKLVSDDYQLRKRPKNKEKSNV